MLSSTLAAFAAAVRRGVRHAAPLMLAALAGCGGGDSTESTGNQTAPPPALPTTPPVVSLSASATSVDSGRSVTLQWSAVGADECTASGGWNGTRAVAGSQLVGPLTTDTMFTLTCTGPGGSDQESITVQVTGSGSSHPTDPPSVPAPTVKLSASAESVEPNGTATLSWSSTNATSCVASGGWSGNKPTSGSQIVGPLAAAATFALLCSGPGGDAQASVTVAVASGEAGTVHGTVDSSLVSVGGSPAVYVFAGEVTPDDRDGDAGDPLLVAAVEQDANACTFRYAISGLAPGKYTLAFTPKSDADAATRDDAITFSRTATITVAATPVTQHFEAKRILRVGPGRTYRTIADAADAAQDGDVIEGDAGTYPDDVVVWRRDGIVVRGVGGRAHVQGTRVIGFSSGNDRENGKGLWVVRGMGMRIENIEFSNARVEDENGAGIRNEGRDLTICNCVFRDNENGFLGAAIGTLTIEYSTFFNNGIGDGYTHNVYVDGGSSAGDRLIFRFNDSHHVRIGHTLKTRARENHILYNRLMDESDGTSSYNIDVPNGGLTFVIGNVIQQGPNTDNSAMIAYGAEGLHSGRTHALYLVNNTLVNDRGSGVFVTVNGSTSMLRSVNNLFVGGGTTFQGKQAQSSGDVVTNAPGFVNRAGYDYRLTSGSPAVNVGTDPGSAEGVSLVPLYEYDAGGRRRARPVEGQLDAGAYEFVH